MAASLFPYDFEDGFPAEVEAAIRELANEVHYTDHSGQSGALTIAADDGTHAMVLTGDLTITLTGSNGSGVIIDASGDYVLTVAGIEVADLASPAVFLKSKGSWKQLNAAAEYSGPTDPGDTPDTTSPTAPALAIDNSSQTQLVANMSGGTDAIGVTQYRSRIDGGSWFTGAAKTFAGLTAGTSHTIDAQAGDVAGNWSTSTSLTRSTASAANAPHDAITADSPSFYFPLDDAPGTTTPHNDGSLTIPASAQGSPTFTGSALSLNGAAQYIRLGSIEFNDTTSPFYGLTSFTLEAVLEYGDVANRWFGHTYFFSTWSSSGSNVHVYLNGSDAAFGATSAPGPHHFAIRYDGSNITSYIDGVQNGIVAATGATGAPDGWTGIGGVPSFTQWFVGNISHFAFYRNVALSPARIAAHAQAHGLT